MALQHGAGYRPSCVETQAHHPARRNLWTKSLQQSHVDCAIQADVEGSRLGELSTAVGGEVGSAPGEMKAFDSKSLIGHFETNPPFIAQVHMHNFSIEGGEIARRLQVPRISQGTAKRKRASHSR